MEILFIVLLILFWIFSYFVKPDKQEQSNPKPKYKHHDILTDFKESIETPIDLGDNPIQYGDQFMSAKDKSAYLQSPEWQTLRFTVFERDGYMCQSCGSKHNLNCHHISYENLGNESLEQLTTLCQVCHTQLHQQLGYDRTTLYPIKELTND